MQALQACILGQFPKQRNKKVISRLYCDGQKSPRREASYLLLGRFQEAGCSHTSTASRNVGIIRRHHLHQRGCCQQRRHPKTPPQLLQKRYAGSRPWKHPWITKRAEHTLCSLFFLLRSLLAAFFCGVGSYHRYLSKGDTCCKEKDTPTKQLPSKSKTDC